MYLYDASGLPEVWLVNGYTEHDTPYGKGISITNAAGLHKAVGRWLLSKPSVLSGAEVRFLRKEQELSQKGLGEVLGVDAQAVARWERGKTKLPKWADHFIRAVYHEFINGDGPILEMIQSLNELDAREREKTEFSFDESEWKAVEVDEAA